MYQNLVPLIGNTNKRVKLIYTLIQCRSALSKIKFEKMVYEERVKVPTCHCTKPKSSVQFRKLQIVVILVDVHTQDNHTAKTG